MRKLIILGFAIFVTACAQNTQSQIKPAPTSEATKAAVRQACDPIYGRASDWDAISDDLARNIYKHNRMCEKNEK